jgi:transcriptional regulator with XRE-family HTH domain
MPKDVIVPGSEIGHRLLSVIYEAGRTVNSVEEQLKLSRGHLGRIIRGQRWKGTVDTELARRLADALRIKVEWLLYGTGPKCAEEREPTDAEKVFAFCRSTNTREDAIQQAWERNKDRASEMSVTDWLLAVNAEAVRLSGTPRPEVVREKQRSFQRLQRRKERLSERDLKGEESIEKVSDINRLRASSDD